jgi:hypothetical protein
MPVTEGIEFLQHRKDNYADIDKNISIVNLNHTLASKNTRLNAF